MEEQLLMVTGAAKILGRSSATVRWYANSGRLRSVRADNGTRLFRETDVQRLAQELVGKSARPSEREPVAAN